jgi:hypothetical protein
MTPVQNTKNQPHRQHHRDRANNEAKARNPDPQRMGVAGFVPGPDGR